MSHLLWSALFISFPFHNLFYSQFQLQWFCLFKLKHTIHLTKSIEMGKWITGNNLCCVNGNMVLWFWFFSDFNWIFWGSCTQFFREKRNLPIVECSRSLIWVILLTVGFCWRVQTIMLETSTNFQLIKHQKTRQSITSNCSIKNAIFNKIYDCFKGTLYVSFDLI